MIPILLCSVISLALFLERLWALQRPHVIPTQFTAVVTELIQKRQFDQASALCKGNGSSFAAIIGAGLRHADKDRGLIKEVMEEAGRRETAYLERGVGVVGSIANISPLLGLLGTVTGMIKVFQRVVNQVGTAGGGQVNAGALANGIWEALITTAAGLAVAIPTLVLFKYLTGKVDRLLVEMEERSLELAELMVASPSLALPVSAPSEAPGAQEAG
jgi:biopolymer transport protein ExbB